MKWDYLIVGAGFAGLTFAERVTRVLGKSCLLIEKRNHIGGNSHDRYDDAGILIHPYGPHYFRTNSQDVIHYLSEFTDWHDVVYRVQSWADGRYWSFPINLKTFEQLIGRPSQESEFKNWLLTQEVAIENPRNSEEVIVSQVGWMLYEKFFKNYTIKQWKRDPSELKASVCGRIPIRTDRNDAYLREKFQALPAEGYHRLFERMIKACSDRLELRLNTDYRSILDQIDYDFMVYTGPIDAFFDHRFGVLPYRSLRFEYESFGPEQLQSRLPISGKPGFWQPEMQVNYPNDFDFTRIVEIKHATGQISEKSTIVKEYPIDYDGCNEPFYPVPSEPSSRVYEEYKSLAKLQRKTFFLGRLATYQYYNMDQVVASTLVAFDRHKEQLKRHSF